MIWQTYRAFVEPRMGVGCPSRGRGDAGAGASIFRAGYATKAITLRTVPVTICLGYALGRSGEVNAGRAKHAALLH
jgi:hypothetical protein